MFTDLGQAIQTSITDMTFVLRQMQEKCIVQKKKPYTNFRFVDIMRIYLVSRYYGLHILVIFITNAFIFSLYVTLFISIEC